MDISSLRRNLTGAHSMGVAAGKELQKVWSTRTLDATSKSKIKNSIMGQLNQDITESAATSAKLKLEGDTSKAHILYKNDQILEAGKFVNDVLDINLDILESMANSTQTLELNRAIVLPTLMTTYLSSSGKDKVPYRVTNERDFKRKAKVVYYKIGNKLYNSAEAFRDASILNQAADVAVNAKSIMLDLSKSVNGVLSFEANKVVKVELDTAAATVGSHRMDTFKTTDTTELVAGLTIGAQGRITHLQFTDGTTTVLVKAPLDGTGKVFELNGFNKFVNMKDVLNPLNDKKGSFLAEYDAENKEFSAGGVTAWGLIGLVFEVLPLIWQEGAGVEAVAAEPEVRIETIDKTIKKKCIQKFTYNPETKVLWEDLAGLDIVSETLLAFQNYKINHKDNAVFKDIKDSMDLLRSIYGITKGDVAKDMTINGAITNGYISGALDFKAATDQTRFLQERQAAKFERLVELMGYCSTYFRKFTHANSIVTNWGLNSSAALFISNQKAAIGSESNLGGVRPINTVYYFEHGGVPMKTVISEREEDYVLKQSGDNGVVMNGYPLFGDENIESKCFMQWFIFQQFEAPDYRLTTNPLQKAMIDIDNYDIITYGHMGAEIKLTNLNV